MQSTVLLKLSTVDIRDISSVRLLWISWLLTLFYLLPSYKSKVATVHAMKIRTWTWKSLWSASRLGRFTSVVNPTEQEAAWVPQPVRNFWRR
jgi:hypothetical protein